MTADDLRSFALEMRQLCLAVPAVKRALVGRRVDIDPGYARSFGEMTYEYAAIVEFDGRDGLISYLKDPQHAVVGRLFWKYCSSTSVVEIEAGDILSQ